MPLYMLVRPSGKGGGKGSKTAKGLHEYMNKRGKRAPPCYAAEAPQEFDEEGKELGMDAQVWKTYVREADQVDEELVDGWNKSMDVILIFAALFSAISTAFVIESYKNLKQDPTDLSSQTLLTISQTLLLIANGSQATVIPPTTESDTPVFQASAKAVCVNVLWFLSLSLSVAVSLISMLAKEWCLEYMAGRTGPAGPQARRRQQRWDGLVKWRMRELIMMLPSLIHISLLLFAIGLCLFLWDVHYGVAIPVVVVTTIAASAYFACTLVPFLYDYCPYGTVLSRLAKQFMTRRSKSRLDNVVQDEVTANALHWMIVTCETPRSVDIALQSLAAADESLPTQVLETCHAWAMIKQRLECGDTDMESEQFKGASKRYTRALQGYPITRKKIDNLRYGIWGGKEEQVVLGIQATIQSLINEALQQIEPRDVSTAQILRRCVAIGQYYLSQLSLRALDDEDPKGRYQALVKPDSLAEDLVTCLQKCVSDEVTFNLELYRTLSASLALLLCCMRAGRSEEQLVYISYSLRLFRSYSSGLRNTASDSEKETIAPNLLLATLWLLIDFAEHDTSNLVHEALDCLWATLMTTAYSDISVLKRGDITYLAHGMLHLLANPNRYNLSPEDCEAIETVLHQTVYHRGLPTKIQSLYHAHYIHCLTQNITTTDDPDALAPQVLRAVNNLRIYSPWYDGYVLPSIEIYILVVKYLCMVKDSSSTDSNHAYLILGSSPIPKCSPQLVQALSLSDLITHLANAIDSDNRNTQLFATAQLWVFMHMSICEADRTSPALSLLETELLKYPKLEGNIERQEAVAEELENKLMVDIDEGSSTLDRYTYRVLEVMLQRGSTPLPELVNRRLKSHNLPKRLRGIESFVNYETEQSVAYPELVFDSEGRPSRIPPSEEQRA